MHSKRALFVSDTVYLQTSPGGAQICTQEYLDIIRAAGFLPVLFSYTSEQRFFVRLKRKIWPQPYVNRLPPLADDLADYAKEQKIDTIFLNQVDLAPIAMQIRKKLGDQYRIILLSHGLESVDIFHAIRIKNGKSAFKQATFTDWRTLSQSLIAEHQHRQYIDYVFCLSSFELELERWLGARHVTYLPRIISTNPLAWNPHSSRIGFVGTVDHPPNAEGLVLFLEALEKIAPSNVYLRLVGGPETAAKAIAKRFSHVEYLGQLSNEELEREASTWNCFVHPLFCYSRGCSTKLAVALGWQIPIVTTLAGCRGYTWSQGKLPLAETPVTLAKLAVEMLDPEVAKATRQEISAIVNSTPSLDEVATQVRRCLSIFCQDYDFS